MLNRIVKKINQRRNQHLFNSEDISELVEAKVQIYQFTCCLNAPFLNYLHWCENLSELAGKIEEIVDELDTVSTNHLQKIKENLDLCSSNFQKLVIREAEEMIRQAKAGEISRTLYAETVIDECLINANYSDKTYREWCRDTSDKLSDAYFRLRIVIDKYVDEYSSLEAALQTCLMGYLEHRMETILDNGLFC